jgi:protein-tyrosine phosphatase
MSLFQDRVVLSTDDSVGPWLEQMCRQPVLSMDFSLLRTLSLSHSTRVTDEVLRDHLAPLCVHLIELLLPHSHCIISASCIAAPHWNALERLSLHACSGLTSLWLDVNAVPVRLNHVDVTDSLQCHLIPSDQARVIAARGGRWGVECDQPQIVFDGDNDDSGTVAIGTNALTCERLCALELDAVISLCSATDLPPNDAVGEWQRAAAGRDHMHVVIEDEENALLPFDDTCAFLNRHRGKRRLVHCVVGASRSAATIAAWLIVDRGIPLEAALAQLRAVRPICAPNAGFVRQLQSLNQSACRVDAVALDVDGGSGGT